MCQCYYSTCAHLTRKGGKNKWNGLILHKMKIERCFSNMLTYFGHHFFYRISNKDIQDVSRKRIRKSIAFMLIALADSSILLDVLTNLFELEMSYYVINYWLRIFFVKFLIKEASHATICRCRNVFSGLDFFVGGICGIELGLNGVRILFICSWEYFWSQDSNLLR